MVEPDDVCKKRNRIPTDPNMRKLWLHAIRRENSQYNNVPSCGEAVASDIEIIEDSSVGTVKVSLVTGVSVVASVSIVAEVSVPLTISDVGGSCIENVTLQNKC
ncbi:unnamed protein product [Acanthoscelides obtectus]|uniref:Uncharacterized protein n=1 Tax=Acanthoscelides obtectus TaxID=200917 RepID=A0A9P0LK55_ACAOB|nr:unnamed protein product [Acanthoscelides obtectus]CAK1621348.1 hypothetical protein AOBTE_LOCUS908 [Acanthoscelides obtectus]